MIIGGGVKVRDTEDKGDDSRELVLSGQGRGLNLGSPTEPRRSEMRRPGSTSSPPTSKDSTTSQNRLPTASRTALTPTQTPTTDSEEDTTNRNIYDDGGGA